MRSHTVVALVAAGLAAVAAFVLAQSVRRLDEPPPADPTWAAQLLGSVLRVEAAVGEPDVRAVQWALEPGVAALRKAEQSVASGEASREAAALEDAYRRWRVALDRGLELRE